MRNYYIIQLLFCVLFMSLSNGAKAATYSHTFENGQLGTATPSLSGIQWSFVPTWAGSSYLGWDSTRGLQIGSSNNPASTISLSTSAISGTITSVKVTTCGASGTSANVSVSVGGKQIGATTSLTTTATETNFTATETVSGAVLIKWNISAKAVYIKKIEITYSTTPVLIPTLSLSNVSNNKIEFGRTRNNQVDKTIIINASDLTEDIDLAITGNNTAQFGVDLESISKTNAALKTGVEVVVTYYPTTAAESHSATLTISTPGVSSQIISLTGETEMTVGVEDGKADETKIYAEGLNIVIESVNKTQINVYNLQGESLFTDNSFSGKINIPANKGIYIIKVGDKTAKIVL